VQEVDELAFLFGREQDPDPHGLGKVIGVDSDRIGALSRAEGAGRSWPIGVKSILRHRLVKLLELDEVGDGGDELEVLTTAGVCLLKEAAHRNDVVRPQHLQLEVGVVGDRHELGIARTPEDGVVRSLKIHHLEDQGLGAEVVAVAEHDRQLNVP
jgi:hypothetical protein